MQKLGDLTVCFMIDYGVIATQIACRNSNDSHRLDVVVTPTAGIEISLA